MSTEAPDVDVVAALATEVAQLRDLFVRRLAEDRAKQQLYDRLYGELDFARADLVRQFIAPLCRELVLVLDRLTATGSAPDADRGVVDELSEILARRGVRPFGSVGSPFDPQCHEAAAREPVAAPERDGHVVREIRQGYLIDGTLLRPALVVVGRWTPEPDVSPR
ncbi:MAG: nucleotide exchange factor GrpE [Actinobacteria bacterium 13_1_20CM_3_71_11]|nr:MAG: nucleotide exchange factor GrpE [Actinobacteria bacterium 13_1_20CM_3_71_11]